MNISELDISVRTFNVLSGKVKSVEELIKLREVELMKIVKSTSIVEDINEALLIKGLHLNGNE